MNNYCVTLYNQTLVCLYSHNKLVDKLHASTSICSVNIFKFVFHTETLQYTGDVFLCKLWIKQITVFYINGIIIAIVFIFCGLKYFCYDYNDIVTLSLCYFLLYILLCILQIPVSSWFDDPNDTELRDLIPFFEALDKVDNVLTVLGNSPIRVEEDEDDLT